MATVFKDAKSSVSNAAICAADKTSISRRCRLCAWALEIATICRVVNALSWVVAMPVNCALVKALT